MVQATFTPLGFDLVADAVVLGHHAPWDRNSLGCVNQSDASFGDTWSKATTTAAGHRVIMVVALTGDGGRDLGLGATTDGVEARRILHFPGSTLPCGPKVHCRRKTKKGSVLVPEMAWATTTTGRLTTD